MNILTETRLKHNLSQNQVSKLLGCSTRTCQRLETLSDDSIKVKNAIKLIESNFTLDETHGLLSIESIKYLSRPVLAEYNISLCYLFGSYAKGTAKPTSDVDLLVDLHGVNGLQFFAVVEKLRVVLSKKVDLITVDQLTSSKELLETILKEGIRLHG